MSPLESLGRIWKLVRYNRDWPTFLWSKIHTPRGDELMTFRLRNGQVITIRADIRFILNEIYRDGVYDVPGVHLSECRTILDIGANMGLFALHALACAPDATVYCFEPSSNNYAVLEQNIRRNHANAKLFKVAVAAESGRAMLSVTGTSAEHRLTSGATTIGEVVECVDFQSAFDLAGVKTFDLVKIDIEGAERPLLDATSDDVLRRIFALVLEWHYRLEELQPLVERLTKLGFVVHTELLHGTRYLRARQPRENKKEMIGPSPRSSRAL